MIADYTVAIGENASIGLPLSRREKRLPDCPGVHAATFEGGSRIRRSEEYCINVLVLHSRLFEQLHQQEVNVGAFVERHLLALELGHCLDGRILGNENGLSSGSRRLISYVD